MAISLPDAVAQATGTTNTTADEPETVKIEIFGDDRYTHPRYGTSPINIKMVRRTLVDGTVRFDLLGMTPLQFASRLLEAFGPEVSRIFNKVDFATMLAEADLTEFTKALKNDETN